VRCAPAHLRAPVPAALQERKNPLLIDSGSIFQRSSYRDGEGAVRSDRTPQSARSPAVAGLSVAWPRSTLL